MDKAGRKRRRLNVHDLTSIGKELLDASYTGDLVLFKELAALLDKGRGCLSVAVDSIRDESYGFGVTHMAAAGGNLQLLEFLLVGLSLEADTSDGTGHSPLTYAIRSGRKDVIPFLIEHGASPNHPSDDGFTPFHFAVSGGQQESTEILLSSGLVDVNQSFINGTYLHLAASVGNDVALRLLLAYEADVNIKVNDFTPLALAILAPSPKCVKLLVEAGADVKDLHPVSHLIQSANNGLSDFMRRLVEDDASLDILYDEDCSEEAPMVPFPSCSSVHCHHLSRLTIGCCGQCYCCLQHLLQSHPKDHAIGLPRLLGAVNLDMQVPGCVHPACPPWWLHKAFRMGDQIVYEYLCSDETVGDHMSHYYLVGQNEPMVEFYGSVE